MIRKDLRMKLTLDSYAGAKKWALEKFYIYISPWERSLRLTQESELSLLHQKILHRLHTSWAKANGKSV